MCLKGKLGFKGERGYSTYELAVKHGFVGTEEEWLETLGIEQVYQYVDTKAAAIESTCVAKANFAVITGYVETPTLGGKSIDYPTGFSRDNCVVLSSMQMDTDDSSTSFWSTFYTTNNGDNQTTWPSLVVQLKTNNIKIVNTNNYLASPKIPYYYKIVLMKIS